MTDVRPEIPPADRSGAKPSLFPHRVGVAYCRRGAACGNPYLKGEVHYTLGFYVTCPRCGGDLTNRKPS